MAVRDTEVLTIAEAACLLGVTPATLRRRVIRGAIPGHRDAANRLTLRRSDIAADRDGNGTDPAPSDADDTSLPPARLTPERRERGLAALARLRARHARLLAERDGRPFTPSSLELLDAIRDERTRHLG